jgi:hypothetical protein
MLNRLAIKLLRQEASRLRSENRELRHLNNELIDKFVFQKMPVRLQVGQQKEPDMQESGGLDGYTAAMQDAERRAEEQS